VRYDFSLAEGKAPSTDDVETIMSSETCEQERPETQSETSPIYAGRYPQTVAKPEAAAAMGDSPDEMGYYRSNYDGKLYAKMYVRGTGTFSDGTPMVLGEKRFFEVKPIAWYPFRIGEGRGVLVSRNVLFARIYDETSNVWNDCALRDHLVNFALGCLDDRTKARIVELPLDNDSIGQTVVDAGKTVVLDAEQHPWCVQPVTWDGVFIFNRDEWQGLQCDSRTFAPTDYAKAMGAVQLSNGYGTGWLRSADSTAMRVATFGFDTPKESLTPCDTGCEITREMGVVPVISVKMV
jgi:hypothetical protein